MIAAAMALALGGGGLMVHAAPEAQAADRLNSVYQFKDTNYPVPDSNVLWVATDGSDSNPGTEAAPLRNIGDAVKKASDGYTIVVKEWCLS